MSSQDLRSALRSLRTVFVAFLALAGLILCLTAMHALPVEHSANAAPITATAITGHHEVQSAQGAGVFGAAASCQGPCGQDHFMMATMCAIALLAPLLLIGAARITEVWQPFARRLQHLSQYFGALPPLMPPSLLQLSISRT